MEVSFQKASISDAELLLGFMRRLYEHTPLDYDERRARSALTRLIDEKDLGRVWLIRIDDETAGYLVLTFGYSLEFGGRDALIDEIYLDESHRDQGIGKRALEFVVESCRSMGIGAVHLQVDRRNEAATKLYLKQGFRRLDRDLMTRWVDQ